MLCKGPRERSIFNKHELHHSGFYILCRHGETRHTFAVGEVAVDFLRGDEQIDHLPEGVLKVHLLEHYETA